jgi:hypothetical protein
VIRVPHRCRGLGLIAIGTGRGGAKVSSGACSWGTQSVQAPGKLKPQTGDVGLPHVGVGGAGVQGGCSGGVRWLSDGPLRAHSLGDALRREWVKVFNILRARHLLASLPGDVASLLRRVIAHHSGVDCSLPFRSCAVQAYERLLCRCFLSTFRRMQLDETGLNSLNDAKVVESQIPGRVFLFGWGGCLQLFVQVQKADDRGRDHNCTESRRPAYKNNSTR